MNTTRVTNPETIREEFKDISIVEVKQAFAAFTAHLQAYHEDNFEMVTLQNGTLRNDLGNEILTVYLHDIDHNGTDEMVIITNDDKIQSEVESIAPLWHNLIVQSHKMPEMTARQFHEKYLADEMTLDEALSELSVYTAKGAGYYTQFPDANLILSDEQEDFVDFAIDFLEWRM